MSDYISNRGWGAGTIPDESNGKKEHEDKLKVVVADGHIRISCPCCGEVLVLSNELLNGNRGRRERDGDSLCSCHACGYEWISNVERPKRCPKCGSYKWDVEPVRLKCNRCSYTWISRNKGLPNRCPSCRSVYWNVPGPIASESCSFERERTQSELERDMDSATDMCLGGRGVMEVCEDMNVPILPVIRKLAVNNHEYRL